MNELLLRSYFFVRSTDDLTRQKATAEHGKIDSEQKLRNMT